MTQRAAVAKAKTVVAAAVPARAMFVVVHGDEPGRRIPLTGEAIVLGRGHQATVKLEDLTVARQHARVELENGQWVVRDLDSPSGTYVNDQHVGEYVLRDGDRVRVGRIILKLLEKGDLESRCAEELFRIRTLDGLTLAASREVFDEALAREVSRARRYGQALSLVLLDVDGFRKLNDKHGEAAGNVVLQRLTMRLKATLRRQDVFARIGDDEFAVVLPGCEANDAQQTAERLLRAADAEAVETDGGALKVTVSAGFARLRSKEDARLLSSRAAKALARAQAAGGNRVEDANPWVPTADAATGVQATGNA